MRVISKPRLREFWEKHSDAEVPLLTWWKAAKKARWSSIQDIKRTYPQADAVMLDCGLLVTIFNIGGRKYRLVTRIVYEYGLIYVKSVMTHSEYSKDRWKVQLCSE